MAFRCGVQTPSITPTPLHSKSSAQPASFDRPLIVVLAPPKNQILKIQILDRTRDVPGLLVLINQSLMNLTLPNGFYFLRSICFVTGLTIDLADQPGWRRASSKIYSSNPGTWVYLPILVSKPWEGLVLPPPLEVETRDGSQETLNTCELLCCNQPRHGFLFPGNGSIGS